MTRRLLLAVAILALLPASAFAQAMDTYGLGSRSVALAGAVSADVEDWSANYYNPAGLVRGTQVRVGVGWFYADHNLNLSGAPSAVDPVHGSVVGLNVPGQIGDVRFGFGLALHLPDQRISRTRSLPRTRPRWELYDNRGQRLYLAAHAAIQPVEWLRIGGGLAFLSTSDLTLEIRGLLDALSPETGARLEHQLSGELLSLRYPQIGIQIQPIEELSFGVTYRGEFGIDTNLLTDVMADIAVGGLRVPGTFFLLTESVNTFAPHQLSFAVSGQPLPWLRVNAELTWLNWGAYESPLGRTDVSLIIDVPPGLENLIAVPDEIEGTRPLPSGFRDRWVPRIGVEAVAYSAAEASVLVRAGYFYENSPAPPQTGLTNLVDTDRHAWSLGVGTVLSGLRPLIPGQLSIDAHVQASWLPSRVTRKTSPIDPVGDYVARGYILAGGITAEVAFE